VQPGTAQWRAWYEQLVTDAATLVTASGAHVTWLTHPCVADPARNRFLPAVNEVYRTVAARLPRVDLVDLAHIVCPRGRLDPSTRTSEGTHFSLAAVPRLGPLLAGELARVWHLP
jgi:lysophospholipase L1-like esterase